MRMPRYYVSNEGMGPYATFYCDKCNREYRSQPKLQATVTENVKRGALSGFLRNIPVVGDRAADNIDNNRYRTDMSADELNSAWGEVQQYFRECPTCHMIVCIPDFDEQSGFCDDDSPRRGEIAQAQTEQAVGVMKGFASAFGLDKAMEKAQQAQAGAVTCTKCGTSITGGAKFCPNCGTAAPQPAAATATQCPNCGAQATGAFCGSCGTKLT